MKTFARQILRPLALFAAISLLSAALPARADDPVNLALRKKYVVSDPNVSQWGTGGLTDGSWVPDPMHCFATGTLDVFPKTATIDLETTATVGYVQVGVPGFGGTQTVVLSLSADGQTFTEVGRYVFKQKNQEHYQFIFPAAPARYVRLTYPDHYTETVQYGPLYAFTLEAEVYATGAAPVLPKPMAVPPGVRPPTDVPAAKPAPDGTPQIGFLAQHDSFIKRGKAGPIGALFLGDSITAGWASQGPLWKEKFGAYNPANFGIPGDQTQHVLWRIENGELDGISPKVVVLMIGTNNIGYPNEEIVKGDTAIVTTIRRKLPDTKILLLGIFPRGADITKSQGVRDKIKAINLELAKLDEGNKVRYLDIGDKFVDGFNNLPADVMPDGLHPNTKGYQIWADAIGPLLAELMK